MASGPAIGGRIEGLISGTERPAGLRILVPGYPQWLWRQRERAAVFFGSYVAALAVGLFAWGTPTGLVVLLFAFGTHIASATDAIRQGAFPGFGRWVPVVSASAGIGLGCYAPALALASTLAWPAGRAVAPREGFLVNLWAYHDTTPGTGHWVLFDHGEGRGNGLGQFIAGAGQSVEWFDGRLIVDGIPFDWTPRLHTRRPRDMSLTIPQGHVLIAPGGNEPGEDALLGMVMIESRQVLGRAWAQHYPVWNRRLLR
jgi:hypothetical protein